MIKDWLSPFWDLESKAILSDPYKQNAKSALQEWSQGNGLNCPKYKIKEISTQHGDLKRFYCAVYIDENIMGEGWGSSIKKAEKNAAQNALKLVRN